MNTNLIIHDNVSHHPLGSGSYYFQSGLLEYLTQLIGDGKPCIDVFVGAQPNSSPHIGNMTNVSTAFAVAKGLKKHQGSRLVRVSLDLVDTAPYSPTTTKYDDVVYQKSLRYLQKATESNSDFESLLVQLSAECGVEYRVRKQTDILQDPRLREILQDIVARCVEIAPLLEPRYKTLGIRYACPTPDCGLADKHGIRNEYFGNQIKFQCPVHGSYQIDLENGDLKFLEFNTPLRGLIRCRLFAQDPVSSWVQIKGSDYAGFYAEQMVLRPLQGFCTPITVYTPLIMDWSGAKISKSLYVRPDAYEYLRLSNLSYLLNFREFCAAGFKIGTLYKLVERWINEPKRLFRHYTIYQIHQELLQILNSERESLKEVEKGNDSRMDGKNLQNRVALVSMSLSSLVITEKSD
ncbi:hypothetical protein TWF970_000774 [Orbilia oligospora]|uniref:Uncharacterized protein n=1 Tax=Orbilia oligospora TaxID=2813651 RepID=A0A7C8RKQ2_ORBOL|nr:hypothetical protein TWF970_000774 [Orbilia oligospora]